MLENAPEFINKTFSAIGRLRRKQNKPYLFQILQDEDPKVVSQAIRGLLVYNNDVLVEQKIFFSHAASARGQALANE